MLDVVMCRPGCAAGRRSWQHNKQKGLRKVLAMARKQISLTTVHSPIPDWVSNGEINPTVWKGLLEQTVPVEAFCEHMKFVAAQMQESVVSIGLLTEVFRDFSQDED